MSAGASLVVAEAIANELRSKVSYVRYMETPCGGTLLVEVDW